MLNTLQILRSAEDWKQLVRETISSPDELCRLLNIKVNLEEFRQVHNKFPLRINPYYLSLIREQGDAIWKQAVPDLNELDDLGADDPLAEEEDSPVHNITHRYPDRVLFYVSSVCAMYCRFCTRKRKVGDPGSLYENGIELGLDYIRQHQEIRDVVVSGGDPLMLSDSRIEYILDSLRRIKHIEIIRIGSRIPVTLPHRVTEKLCAILKKYHPLYLNTHFNHPQEITSESKKACSMLADAGIPLGNQSVLLRGVNDKPSVMKKLMQGLLRLRIKPYYIYQADLVKGTGYFRTPVEKGLEIIRALRGHTSGLAVPHYVIDAPGGGGKIALIPNPVVHSDKKKIVLRNYEGNHFAYPSMPDKSYEKNYRRYKVVN